MRALDEIDLDRLGELRAGREPLWLDLRDPDEHALAAVADVLGLHTLALEDSREFGQRPELDRYDDQLLLVLYGLTVDDGGMAAAHRAARETPEPVRGVTRGTDHEVDAAARHP